MMFLTILVLVPVLLWFISYWKCQKYLYSVPGPTPIPILGNSLSLQPGQGLIPSFLNLQTKYGEIVKLMVGYSPMLVISGTKPIEFILSSNVLIDKAQEYKFLKDWLGNGLLVTTGDRWRIHRKLLTPGFHFNILERFVEVFDNQCSVLISKLENISGPLDLVPYTKLYALDVITEAVMSTELNVQNNYHSDYVKSVDTMIKISEIRLTSALRRWDFIHRRTNLYKEELKYIECLHNLSNLVIKKKMAKTDENYDYTEGKKPSLLDILLSCKVDGKPFSLETIREEVNTFLVAGYDTTSSAIGFLLYSLSKNEVVQEKCFQEICEVAAGDLKKQFTFNDLRELRYLEQVIKESLRLYTPVVIIGRKIKEDTYYDGTLLPKGLQIYLNIYGLHHQPLLYPHPDVFDPERFSPENCKNRSMYSYVPFSAGPRNCIGQRFAMLEMKSTAFHILRKFKILPVEGHRPLLTNAVLTSANGLLVQLEKRHYNID